MAPLSAQKSLKSSSNGSIISQYYTEHFQQCLLKQGQRSMLNILQIPLLGQQTVKLQKLVDQERHPLLSLVCSDLNTLQTHLRLLEEI